MADVQLQVTVPVQPAVAFDIYVYQMDTWWPRQGVFPFSFAPKTTHPRHIRFEAQAQGRYYETFADGSEYVIGQITDWQPPQSLRYTWRDPNWPGSIDITVTFAPAADGTLVSHDQDGFAEAGVPFLIPYYQIGSAQTLAGYVAHCIATRQLEMLEQQPTE